MVVPVQPIAGLEGDYIVERNNVVQSLDRSQPTGKYCSGIQILNPAKVNNMTTAVDDFYELWKQLMKQEQLYCSNVFPERWFTVDTMAQLKHINDLEL